LDEEEGFASWREGESQRNRKLGRAGKPWQTKSRVFGNSVFGLHQRRLGIYPTAPYVPTPITAVVIPIVGWATMIGEKR
tara:strand:- start:156 stop:392 length:237 start_codon:yes stop_codon:yes gene_type:complete